jgi:hypothetical protein
VTNAQMIRILRAADNLVLENIRNLNHRVDLVRAGRRPFDLPSQKKARNEFELACRALIEYRIESMPTFFSNDSNPGD